MSSGIYKRIKPAWNKGTTKYEQITCSVCGKLFQAEKWRNRKVCSFRCKIKRFTSSGILSRIGKKPWNYNGKLMLEKQLRNHPKMEKWRKDIFKRYNFSCDVCGSRGYLEAHHIRLFTDILNEFKKLNQGKTDEEIYGLALKYEPLWDSKNGICLCKNCHKITKITNIGKQITEKVRIVNITKAVIRDALTNKIKRVYITQNTIQLAGRNVIARRLANNTTYTGILNYGALLTTGPTETYRKLTASATYDDAVAKAYVTWFFTAAEVSGTFVQWRNYIDGTADSGSGQEWSRVDVNWVKSNTETLTVDCIYQITSG